MALILNIETATVEIQTRKVHDITAVPIQAVTTRDTSAKASSRKGTSDESEATSETEQDSEKKSSSTGQKSTMQECVFVVNEGVVSLRPVRTGIQDNLHIEILEGLKPGEEVVTGPYNAISRLLKSNDVVKVVSREELFTRDKK